MELEIRSPVAADLELLGRRLPLHTPDRHREAIAQQATGLTHYLVAFQAGDPVGSGMIHWPGPREPAILARVGAFPEIYNLGVREDHQGRGIGTALVAALEACVAERGFAAAGLAVALANPRARALYERLGYTLADAPVFVDRWRRTDASGAIHWQEDPCRYLVKPLEPR